MTLRNSAACMAVALTLSAPAAAHDGPRVWIGNVNSTIVTYTSDNDEAPTSYFPARVFVSTFDNLLGVFATDFPGFELRRDGQSHVPNGTTFSFALAGPLLKLDSSTNRLVPTLELFGPPGPGPVPQLGVSLNPSAVVTGTGVVNGFPFFVAFPGNHSHLLFTLLGDGVTAGGGPDGVYVLPMLLNAAALARSEWFFILLQKNNTPGQRIQAIALAQQMADALPGDANFDGTVNIADFSLLATHFNQSALWWGKGDFDFDGVVNISDFSLLAGNFNSAARAAGVVPEPASAAVAVALMFRRKRPRRSCR